MIRQSILQEDNSTYMYTQVYTQTQISRTVGRNR
jgi:hypothetical protein